MLFTQEIPARKSANLFFRALNGDAFVFVPVHDGVLSITTANLFAIGITIDIAIGFIFFIYPWRLAPPPPPPSMPKLRKLKPLAMSMEIPMAKD